MDEDNITMDEFKAAFGVDVETNTGSTDETKPGAEESKTTGADDASKQTTSTEEGAAGSENAESKTGDDPAKARAVVDKATQSAETFAKMRIANNKYLDTLKEVAKVLDIKDINLDNMDELSDTLKQKAVEALAKKQNISPELLQEINYLKQKDAQNQITELKNRALIGFQRVMDEFKLDGVALQTFAEDLIKGGKNPFLSEMDLITEYKLLHFDDLLEQAKASAVQTEAERAAKAQTTGSNPGDKQGTGGSDTDATEVKTVKELEAWFNNNTKK